MGKHSSTLLVLIVLLVAERVKAQYANPAAESAIANNSNAHEPLEKSTDRFASICPCIIADKCSSPYDKAADSPDAVPACTEYGTVRCCSGPLKTAESESIEDEDIADNISYDSLNPKELTQEDHISSSNEEMEDLDVEKEFLAIQPKPEDDENPSGGPETAIETPKELLTDENETDETLQAPAIQPGSPVPEMQKFRYAIPDTIYSQVDPFLLEPVLEQDPGVVQSQYGGNSANFYYVPLSGRQAKELNNKPPVRVPMVVYPPPTSRLFTVPIQRRDSYQQVPVQNYQQNEAVRLSKPQQVQSQQRPATARDNFVLKVYGKPQQPNQKLFLKELVDVSYSPSLQVTQQRADPVPEYPGYPTEVQHQRQPVQHVIERQPAAAFPQSTYQTSIPATLLQEHPQLQLQPNVEYASMDQNGGIHHKLPAQRPVYTQVELAPTQERPSYQRPLPAHNFRPINFFNQPSAWSSPSDQFYEQVASQQSSMNTQMIRPQAEMVDESSEYREVEETESAAPNGEYQSEDEVEPGYEETESPLPQSDQLPSTASGQQPPQLHIVVPESQSSPSYEDQLQIPVPYDQGPPTQATNFEVPTASTAIPYEVPTGAEIKTEASSVSQVPPSDDYRPQEAAKAIEEPTPQQAMNAEEIYDSQGLGMRSNQKLELAILEPIVPGPVQVAGWTRKLPTPPRYELGFRPIVGPVTANPAAKPPVAYETLFRHTVENLPSYKQAIPVKMAQRQRPYENNAPLYTVDQSNSGTNANQRYPRNEVRYLDNSWREQKALRRRFNDQH